MDSTPSTSFSSNSSNDSHPRRGSTKKGRDGGGTGKKDLHESDRNSFALPSPTSQETQPIDINPDTDTGSQGEDEVEVEVESSSLHERAIDQAYEAIWNDFCGLPPSDNVLVFHLGCQRAYEKLHHKLAEKEELLNHYEESLRWDWDEDTGDLILRMGPTTIHETVAGGVVEAIGQELDRITQENPSLAHHRSNFVPTGQCQDGQLRYKEHPYPSLIVEVAYRQDGKDLRQKVQGVLIRFAGQVRTVLGVDIGYANPKKRKPDTYLHKSSVTLVAIATATGY
ncbi:hypothetical protein F5X98DRAFT_374541 [Xylaria grammica]|nr:hypothetical protein F5X98DRAFT_374541 [Xylaria grammica]